MTMDSTYWNSMLASACIWGSICPRQGGALIRDPNYQRGSSQRSTSAPCRGHREHTHSSSPILDGGQVSDVALLDVAEGYDATVSFPSALNLWCKQH
jgi:hypothetical protein